MTDENIKHHVMTMAVNDLDAFLNIVSDLGHIGYKVSLCKLRGFSYLQCANKMGIGKPTAQFYFEKCKKKGYDVQLKKFFNIP